ncbi:hypothetical protein AB0G71_14485 [Streptomyces sp. NPDC020403]|uniref:hypothetical protein n=1 Tax=unclassified Streptomyces TaxID=2593676 RepID=UPI0033D14E8D
MGRVAVFGNDGIRWVEKPAPVQTAFVLGGLTERSGSMVRVKKDWNAVHTVRPTQEEASASRQ